MSIPSEINRIKTNISSAFTAIGNKGGTVPASKVSDNLADAISTIPTGITPSGTLDITTNGTKDVTQYASANVNVPTGTARTSSDLTASGATVNVPAGLYSSDASKSVATMTLPTSAASSADGTNKATLNRSTSDRYINIPIGYNSAKASYKISKVADGSAKTPATTKQQSAPTFSKSGNVITASVAATSVSVTPTVTEGYVSSGTAGTITMSANSATYTIPTETKTATANGTVTPTSGSYLSSVTVAIPEYDGTVE